MELNDYPTMILEQRRQEQEDRKIAAIVDQVVLRMGTGVSLAQALLDAVELAETAEWAGR